MLGIGVGGVVLAATSVGTLAVLLRETHLQFGYPLVQVKDLVLASIRTMGATVAARQTPRRGRVGTRERAAVCVKVRDGVAVGQGRLLFVRIHVVGSAHHLKLDNFLVFQLFDKLFPVFYFHSCDIFLVDGDDFVLEVEYFLDWAFLRYLLDE